MPDLAATLASTVVFLFDQPSSRPLGTAFMIGLAIPDAPDRHVPALVTARHVIAGHDRVDVRFSTLEGKSTGTATYDLAALRSSGDAWQHDDDGVDVFVFRTPAFREVSTFAFPQASIAARETFAVEEIKPPDRIIFPHLLTHFMGTTRNYPVVRDGTLALIPDEPIPLRIDYAGHIVETRQEVLLIDATSIPGASGSPIFLWPVGRLRGNALSLTGGEAYLIGVMHGFYFADPRPGVIAEPTQAVPYFAENSRIAIAFPSWRLLEVVNRRDVTARVTELVAQERALDPPSAPEQTAE